MQASVVEKKRHTIEDYLKTPDDERWELIEGELIMSPAPKTKHQRTLSKLGFFIQKFVMGNNLGEVFYAPFDVHLRDAEGGINVVQPDILFISNERMGIIGEKNVEGAPDLIIEIISEGTEYKDTIKKKHLYEKARVNEYWIIAPDDRIVEIYLLEEDRYRLLKTFYEGEIIESSVLKGLVLDLKTVW